MERAEKSVDALSLCEEITELQYVMRKYALWIALAVVVGMFICLGAIVVAVAAGYGKLGPDKIIWGPWAFAALAIVSLAGALAAGTRGQRISNRLERARQDLSSRTFIVLDNVWYERDGDNLIKISTNYLPLRKYKRPDEPGFPQEPVVTFSLGQTGIRLKFTREADEKACFTFFHLRPVVPLIRNLVERELDDLLYLIGVLNTPFISSGTAEKLKQGFREKLAELGPDKLGPYRIVEIIDNIGDVEADPEALALYQSFFGTETES